MAIILPTVVQTSGLPAPAMVDPPKLIEYESLAYEHWIFRTGGVSGLTGIKSGKVLTKIGPNSVSYNAKSIVLPANGSALATDLADQAIFTWCGVVKLPAVNADQSVWSTFNATEGHAFQVQINLLTISRVVWRSSGSALAINLAEAPEVVGNWFFVAYAMNMTGANRIVRQRVGRYSIEGVGTGAAMPPSTSTNLAIGSPVSGVGGIEIAEAILFGSALTMDQISDVWLRSRYRMYRDSGLVVN